MSIHTLELKKWEQSGASFEGKTLKAEAQWLRFFKEARHWTKLPEELDTKEMRQAMATLKRFSEKEKEYHFYLSRQSAMREEATREAAYERSRRELKEKDAQLEAKDAQLQASQAESAEKDAQLQASQAESEQTKEEMANIKLEMQRLKQLLGQQGSDPDA